MNGELDRGRRLARRRMGWLAFIGLMFDAVVLLASAFFGGPVFAANMAAVQPMLVALIWAKTTVVGAYLGVSLTEAIKKPSV